MHWRGTIVGVTLARCAMLVLALAVMCLAVTPGRATPAKALTSTAMGSSQNPSLYGEPVTFTATVSVFAPGTGTPTGTITFFIDGTNPTTVPLSGASASLTVTLPVASTYNFQAMYNGDANYQESTSPPQTETVNKAPTTTTLSSSENPSAFGDSVTFTAKADLGGGTAPPDATMTFTIDGVAQTPVVVGCLCGDATFTTSSLAPGRHRVGASFSGDTNYRPSAATGITQTVTRLGTTTDIASSDNPSELGKPVTFTATVNDTNATAASGTVTFRDNGTAIGTGALANGTASFTTSALTLGTHAIAAFFPGDGNLVASHSAALTQTVGIPADSIALRAMQVAGTRIVAQNSGQAISNAVDGAISDAFGDGAPFAPDSGGAHLNFAADGASPSEAAAGDFADGNSGVAAKQWLPWVDFHDTGWSTDHASGDLKGSQFNGLAGITDRIQSDFLVGLFGGYEHFDYSSVLLDGRLSGDGWTVGSYAAWQMAPGVRFDATLARSGLGYDDVAGTANGSFPGARWLASGGITDRYRQNGFEIEPSARVFALWEHEDAYTDSLGTAQAARDFATARASAGVKVTYPFAYSPKVTVAPYAGVFADYYFSSDDASPAPLLPAGLSDGWSGRATAGIAVTAIDGPTLSLGGELGGIGGDFTLWSAKGSFAVPF